MLAHFFAKDPHSYSRRKEYDLSVSSTTIGSGGYSEVKLARWHPKQFPAAVHRWLAQQEVYESHDLGSDRGGTMGNAGVLDTSKKGLVVAVKVVGKHAVRNNPEYFKILQEWVWLCRDGSNTSDES
jgi:hypothetical protein